MHKSHAVPSSFHQCIKYPWNGSQETIVADHNPFKYNKVYSAYAIFYKDVSSYNVASTSKEPAEVKQEAPKADKH